MYEKTYVLGVINKETVINTEEKTFTPTSSIQTYTPTNGTYVSKVTVNAVPTETKTATPSTSTQTITPTSGKFLSKVTVNAISTETKTVTPSASSQSVTPTNGKYLSKVTVNAIPSSYIIPSGTKTITENGTHDVKSYANVEVNVTSSGGGGGTAPGDDEYIDFVITMTNNYKFAQDGLLVCSHSPVVTNANGEVGVEGDYSGGLVYPQNSDCWGTPAIPFPYDGYYSIAVGGNQTEVEVARWKVPKYRPVDFEVMSDTMGLPGYHRCYNGTIIEAEPICGWGYRFIVFWDPQTLTGSTPTVTFNFYTHLTHGGGSN